MFKDLVKKNRTVRGFDNSRKVTDEELREMIDCARLSAASMNLQVLKFHLATDPKEVEIIRKGTLLGGALPQLHLPFEGTEPPCYILILHDKEVHPDDNNLLFMKDVGIAAQSITLCATDMGLACCMIGSHNKPELKATLGLEDRYEIQLVIAVGKGIEETKIVEMNDGDSHKYYRDENNVHYVPKRKLEDVIV